MALGPEIFDQFRDQLILDSLSDYTVRTYVYDVEHINTLRGFNSSSQLIKFFKNKKKNKSGYRFSALVVSVRSFAKWAYPEYISEDLYKRIMVLKQVPKSKRVPQRDLIAYNDLEIKQLLSIAKKDHGRYIHGLFWIALNTGLRKRALLSLKLDDVVKLKDGRFAISVRNEIDKMRRGRLIPFSFHNSPEFEKYLLFRESISFTNSDHLIISNRGNPIPLGGGTLDKRYKKLTAKFGTRVTLQNCRYTYARRLWDKTGDLYLTQYLMGHNNPKQTVDYLKIRTRELRSMVADKMKDVIL